MEEVEVIDVDEGEVIGGNPNPTLAELNQKGIQKLYQLIDELDGRDADLVRACIESLAKLNASLKGSDILPKAETDEERRKREEQEAIKEALSQ